MTNRTTQPNQAPARHTRPRAGPAPSARRPALLYAAGAMLSLCGLSAAPCAAVQSADAQVRAAEPGTSAAAPVRSPSTYADLLTKLSSPSAIEREEAYDELAASSRITLAQLEESLAKEPLTPEQRYRVMQAAKQRYMVSPRAAMGVQFASKLPLPDRVVIEFTYPQFPSFKQLKEGDMIVAVEGEQLRTRDAWTRLGAHIVSHDPGDSIDVVIRRGAERLELRIELGTFQDLPGAGGVDLSKLERGWELRSARFTPSPRPEPLAFAVPAAAWTDEPLDDAQQRQLRVKMQLPTGYKPRLVAGGEPRGGELDENEIWTAFNNNKVNLINPLAPRRVLMNEDLGTTLTIQQEIAQLESFRERIAASARQPAGARPPNEPLTEWTLRGEDGRRQLRLVSQSLDALRAEAAQALPPVQPVGANDPR